MKWTNQKGGIGNFLNYYKHEIDSNIKSTIKMNVILYNYLFGSKFTMAGDSNIWRQHCLQWIIRLCWSAPLDGRVCFQRNILYFHCWHSDTNRSSMRFSEWKSSKPFYTCNINTELWICIQNSYTKQILSLFRYLVIPIAMG
jgi:hypothetical protein